MITRNDDPPEEHYDPRPDKVADELVQISVIGLSFEEFLAKLNDYVIKKMDEAYADGYVDGTSAAAEAHESEGT